MNMKFVKGLVIGGLVTTGMVMLWQNDNMFNTNKMMKKGKKFAKKMGIIFFIMGMAVVILPFFANN